jgi:Zn-dependent peptidase ImmA (M78 family)
MKPDDSSLLAAELRAVEARAKLSLDKAAAWGRFPTPVNDIVAAANLRVASKGLFDPAALLEFARRKTAGAIFALKTAISKVFGVYDANEQIIHIDDAVGETKQTFLKLHETGHHELPAHRKIFTFFQECEQTLAPQVADLFEREANNFARYALFQGSAFKERAADLPMGIKTPMDLAKKFGASTYAAVREYARSHHLPCLVYALELPQWVPGQGMQAEVRRIETSPSFEQRFGRPSDAWIGTDHPCAELLPAGNRKMTRPTLLIFRDRNGVDHECLGEAFKTPFNVFLLIYPIKALDGATIAIPILYFGARP